MELVSDSTNIDRLTDDMINEVMNVYKKYYNIASQTTPGLTDKSLDGKLEDKLYQLLDFN